MPEQVNSKSLWLQRLESLGEKASALETVTSEIKSVTENIGEIKKQSEDFIKTVSDSPKKSQTENTAVKEDEKKQKYVSIFPAITNKITEADKEADE